MSMIWRAALGLSFICFVSAAQTHFICNQSNELLALVSTPSSILRWDTVVEALAAANRGDALVVLSANYPVNLTAITAAQYAEAAQKGVRIFVEFPSSLPPSSHFKLTKKYGATPTALDTVVGVAHGGMQSTISRLVAVSNMTGLHSGQIMAAHGAVVLPIDPPLARPRENVYVAAAQVAGFDKTIFGMPTDASKSAVVLFAATDDVLLCTTRISNVITARYGPIAHWQALFAFIFEWLDTDVVLHTLVPAVRPRYAPSIPVTDSMETAAVSAAVKHLTNTSGLLYSPTTPLATLTRHCPVAAEHTALQAEVTCIDEGLSSTIDRYY
jgi:hypothetical protein